MIGVSSEAFKLQLRDHFQGLLNKSFEIAFLLPTDPSVVLADEIASMRAAHAKYKQRLATQEFSQGVLLEARQLLEQSSLVTPVANPETVRLACNAVQRARIEDIRILIAQLEGDYGDTSPHDPMFAGMSATEMPAIPGEAFAAKTQSGLTLSQSAEAFINFKSGDWVKKTAGDIKRTLNLASVVIGPQKQISSIDTDDVKKMRDALAKLPANYMKASSNAGLNAKDALSGSLAGAKLSIKTQQKYLFMFKSLLKWCRDENYIDKIPGPGIKVAGLGKIDPADQRDP